MKTRILNMLPALPLLLLISCSVDDFQQMPDEPSGKDSGESVVQERPEGCDHTQLVHHPEVKATSDKGGSIEYWECPHCLKAYSDPAGECTVKGYIYTLPTKYLQDLSPLASLTGAPKTKSAVETAQLVISCVSMASGIASLAVGIASLSNSVGEILDSYENLEAQSEKTQEELERMERYYRQIEDYIDTLTVSSAELLSSLQEMESSLETLNATLVEIDKTLVELTASIRDIADDVRADLIIDDRHQLRTMLQQPAADCYTAMLTYLAQDVDDLRTADNFKDSLDVFRTVVDHQTKVIDGWALSDNDRVADAMTFITTFNSVSYNYRENIPVFLEQYTDNHVAWEHLGFAFRRSYLLQDLYLMSLGMSLSKTYFALNKDMDKVYAAKKSELLSEQYETARKNISADSLKMAAAYHDHRLCNVNGRKYDVRPHLVSFKDFCDKFVQVEGTSFKIYPQTYNYILYDMPQDSSITREDVELMERFYFGTAETIDDLYFGKDNGGLELMPPEPLSDPQLVVPYATDDPVICPDESIRLVCTSDGQDHFIFPFWGCFHNPFLSSDFLCRTDKKYERIDYIFKATDNVSWSGWPDCFTPIYYSEAESK